MLVQHTPPRHQAEAQPIIDHGEAAAGKLGRADKSATDMVAGNGRLPLPSALGGERPAGTVDVSRFKPPVSHCRLSREYRLWRSPLSLMLRTNLAGISHCP
jgi:hypothetical protein